MKLMRRLLRLIFLLGIVLFLVGAAPLWATTVSSSPTSGDEHPWDNKLKDAYRVEVILVTDEYVLLAVWYTKDQIYPVFIWVKYESQQTVLSPAKSRPSVKRAISSFF